MNTEDTLLNAGYEDVIYFSNFGYDDALIGVDTNNRAVYDFEKMVKWLLNNEDFDNEEEAIEWIEYNTVRALPYIGENGPIIMYPINQQ